jgi:hypothetical protein
LKKTTTLRNAGCLLLLTFVTGLLVSGASSYIVVQLVVQKVGPIFWEGGEGYLPMFAAVFGGILAILSAAFCRHIAEYPSISKILVGLGIGIGLSLAFGVWAISGGAFTSPRAPKGISFWTVVVLIIAGGLAGVAGSLMSDKRKWLMSDIREWQLSLRSLLVLITRIAIVLGLVVLFV